MEACLTDGVKVIMSRREEGEEVESQWWKYGGRVKEEEAKREGEMKRMENKIGNNWRGELLGWGSGGKKEEGKCRAADGWRVKSQSAAEVQREEEERRGERHLVAEGGERREKRERGRESRTQ